MYHLVDKIRIFAKMCKYIYWQNKMLFQNDRQYESEAFFVCERMFCERKHMVRNLSASHQFITIDLLASRNYFVHYDFFRLKIIWCKAIRRPFAGIKIKTVWKLTSLTCDLIKASRWSTSTRLSIVIDTSNQITREFIDCTNIKCMSFSMKHRGLLPP